MPNAPIQLDWSDDRTLSVGDTRFWRSELGGGHASTDELLVILKPRDLIEQYVQLIESFHPKRIMELGIFRGGSTALLALIADPTKLVAVDILDERIPSLDRFIESHGFSGRVEAHYQVDQGDKAQLGSLVAESFGDEPLDLVLDDASHTYSLSRRSFEVLFPRLRAGGLYVIEDWAWAHMPRGYRRTDETPLSMLVFELLAAQPHTPGVIDGITVNDHWVAITRGPAPLDPVGFNLSDHYSKRSHELFAPLYRETPPSR